MDLDRGKFWSQYAEILSNSSLEKPFSQVANTLFSASVGGGGANT
jgi:hypothetical protein